MDRPTTWSVDYRKLSKFITNINTPAHAEVFILVSYEIQDWNQLKRVLIDWHTVLDTPSVKKVREQVLV